MGIIDNALWKAAEAGARHGANRQAQQFADSVKLGKTYYTVHTSHRPEGPVKLVHEHVFVDRLPLTGTPVSEAGAAATSLWLTSGPVLDKKPRGLKTMAEYEAEAREAADFFVSGHLGDYSAAPKPKRGRKAA